MKKKANKILSLLLVFSLAIGGILSSPGLAASAAAKSQDSSKNSLTYEQKVKELALLKENLKSAPGFNARINEDNTVEIYTDEVAKINAKAALSGSGLRYGSWFGGEDSYYQMSPSQTVKLLTIMIGAIEPFVATTTIAIEIAESITNTIGSSITVYPGQVCKVDRTKRYREVTYSDGSFAYWQTKVGASVTKADTYLGYGETIISGGMW